MIDKPYFTKKMKVSNIIVEAADLSINLNLA